MSKLILGHGLLGKELERQTHWEVISRDSDKNFDFNHYICLESYIMNAKESEIINCVGYTNTRDDSSKDLHWKTNYVSVMNLTDICKKYNKKLIHISTDYVYANSKPLAKETDIPIHYDNWYTYTKLLADNYISARMQNFNYLILRSSFKSNPFPFPVAWVDLIGNFDYVDVIAGLMIKLINKNEIGIFNVGTELKSIYDLAKKTNPNVVPIHKPDEYIKSTDISMNLDKMKSALGEENEL